ncbi:Mak16 protein [Mycena polygramma]|nr:Mak16 protein [Mycena polygramma]
MQSDDVIWSVINHQFCSYKVKYDSRNKSSRPANVRSEQPPKTSAGMSTTVTGFCNRQSCPLANSRYATVRESEGVLYLYVKTIERAHSPAHMWERIKLSNNYSKALEQIDNELIHWPNFTIHKCKQRVTKITQYLIKMRRLKLRTTTENSIGIKKKLDRRTAVRERKALSAAHIERSIEKELIERLKSKAYGDAPLNVNETVWQTILDREKNGGKDLENAELDMEADETDEEDEEELEDEMDEWGDREFVSDISEDEDDGLSDLEDVADNFSEGDEDEDDSDAEKDPKTALGKRKAPPSSKPSKKRPDKKPKKGPPARGPRVEVEYENEVESVPLTRAALASW